MIVQRQQCRWSCELQLKLSLGGVHREVLIDGTTTVTTPAGDESTNTGGLLALPTNIGRFFGITIRMYYDDRPPPLFHAYYGDLPLSSVSTLWKLRKGDCRAAR